MSSPVFLSILIPVYNWDIAPLLRSLHAQGAALGKRGRVEIIAADDGSACKFENAAEAARLENVSYVEMPENRGRAAARNHLLHLAKGDYVLFLDADMLPDHDDFVQRYFDLAEKGSDAACGGISYLQADQRDPATSFYIYKSLRTEALPASARNRAPWRYLFTSNIMIRRAILEKVGFDPRFTGYGFEDIEWGLRLQEAHGIEHIDNTCSHMGVMNKDQVFGKMRESVDNYHLLHTLYPEKTGAAGAIGLAGRLRILPDAVLAGMDGLAAALFKALSWNRLLYLLFQFDKAVLLARRLKGGGKNQSTNRA